MCACERACVRARARACVCVCVCVSEAGADIAGTELRSCVKVVVAVLGSPSLIVCTVCVDVKHQ